MFYNITAFQLCDRWQALISTINHAHLNGMLFVSFALTRLLQAILLYDEKQTKFNYLHARWDRMNMYYYELYVLVSCNNGRNRSFLQLIDPNKSPSPAWKPMKQWYVR
jgi:hypothetical protein